MVGEPKVSGVIKQTNIHTIYIGPQDWEDLGKIAVLQKTNVSNLIRNLVGPLLSQFRGGDTFVPQFDVDAKEKELKNYKSKVDYYCESLKKEILPNRRSVFEAMCAFAKNYGTDDLLVRDIEDVLMKLKFYDCTGKELFNKSHLITFILFIDALVNRRRVENEMNQYWQQQTSKPSMIEAKKAKLEVPLTV